MHDATGPVPTTPGAFLGVKGSQEGDRRPSKWDFSMRIARH